MSNIFSTEKDDFISWLWKEGYISKATDEASKDEISPEYFHRLWVKFYKNYYNSQK